MQTTLFRIIVSCFLFLILLGCRTSSDDTTPVATPVVSLTTAAPNVLPEMTIVVEMPTQVERGQRFNVVVRVGNLAAESAENITVILPVPPRIALNVAPINNTILSAETLTWTIETIEGGASLTELLTFTAPYEIADWTLPAAQLIIDGVTVATASERAFVVAGGDLPIEIARDEVGTSVSVVGVVTFYADGTFYIADETGGIRVQTPDGAPNLTFELGQMVKVAGEVIPYDNSVAILLAAETLDAAVCNECVPLAVQATAGASMSGQLAMLTGTVRDIITLANGQQILLENDAGVVEQIWVDDRLGISAEILTIDQQATIVGIYDDWNGNRAVAPRQQSDISPVFPQSLRLIFDAPISVPLTEPLTHTIMIHNDSDEPRTNVVVSAAVPRLIDDLFAGTIITSTNNGRLGSDGVIYWGIPELLPNSSYTVSYKIEYFRSGRATTTMAARAENSDEQLTHTELLFVGQPVPIYEIQTGERSPLRGREVSIDGIVTLVTPERGGFFMQQPTDVLVSSVGIFVETIGDPMVASGDRVQVRGMVRERNGETIVALARDGLVVESSDNPLPEALPLGPVEDSAEMERDMEPFEGMRVKLTEPLLVVSDTKDGLTELVYEKHGLEAESSAYILLVAGLADLTRGDVVEPFFGVVAAEFDQYIILPLPE